MLAAIVLSLLLNPGDNNLVSGPGRGHSASPTSYYVSNTGNDTSDGSLQHPFRTLQRVSQLALLPGDRVLLTGGQTFSGTLAFAVAPKGSKAQPVVLTSTGRTPAIIDALDSNAVILANACHVELSRINCKGSGRKTGNHADGMIIDHCQQVVVRNARITGFQKAGLLINCSGNILVYKIHASSNGAAGILASGEWNKRNCINIRIVQCEASNNPGDPTNLNNHSGNGILAGYCKNVLIDSCTASNNGWDMPRQGNGPVGIWCFESDSVVIQHCISYNNKTSVGGGDGGGFDIDGGVTNSVIQYCLSYNNQGSGFGLFQYDGAGPWNNNTVRFCISINDGNISPAQASVFVWNSSGDSNQLANCYFYNNTIINQKGAAISYEKMSLNKGFRFFNNHFVAGSGLIMGTESQPVYRGNNWYLLHYPGHISAEESIAAWTKRTGHEQSLTRFTGTNKNPQFQVNPANLPRKPEALNKMGSCCGRAQVQAFRSRGTGLLKTEGIDPGRHDFSGKRPGTKMIGAL